jgi:hypothetical protein
LEAFRDSQRGRLARLAGWPRTVVTALSGLVVAVVLGI